MHFALVNMSKLIAGHTGDMYAMAEAGVKLVNERFAPAWNRLPISGAFYDRLEDVPRDACIFTWVDRDKDVADALGYHSQVGNRPYSVLLAGVILEDAKGGIIDVGNSGVSCAQVFGHELLELLVNPSVNDWVEMPDGRFLAKEVCDPVQDGVVLVTLDNNVVVALSDGVFPEYFDPQAPIGGNYSLLGHDVPLGKTLGGYQIIFDPALVDSPEGPIVNAWGPAMPFWQIREKSRRGRTWRRVEETTKRVGNRMLAASRKS